VSVDGRKPAASARPTTTPSNHRSDPRADDEAETTSTATPTDEADPEHEENVDTFPTTNQRPMGNPFGALLH
jgi:hypothetical protein